ncbi:MAG: hypothetical protein ACKVJG_28165 [Candidatus Latescibacterota bacterium]|jgi:Ni/Fe-hydrogenase subunit HybB-like protein
MNLLYFLRSALRSATGGGPVYHLWMGVLTFLMMVGAYAYYVQFDEGLVVTGMSDHVSWGPISPILPS